MKIYLVGGAVRDKLLGIPIKERDWVVVGGTVDRMLTLGYKQVGKEFPVFLHPKTNEEYALARMERKVKAGYKGFVFDTSPSVSLEEDLQRRDLTINAIAETNEGLLIDPYHGKNDIENKILRHVSLAFTEDPVRILRVGRFLARYAYLGFKLAPETIALMRQMVVEGEVNALVPERVWKEWQRALTEQNPEAFFTVLHDSHAMSILFPELQIQGAGIQALMAATTLTTDPSIRFAALLHALPEGESTVDNKKTILALCDRYRIPNHYCQLALLTALYSPIAFQAPQLSPINLLDLFIKLDIFRRETRFHHFLIACEAIAISQQHSFDPTPLLEASKIVRSVNINKLLAKGLTGKELAIELKNERLSLLTAWLKR